MGKTMTDSLENIWSLTFAVRRLNSVLDSIIAWMADHEDSFAEYPLAERIKLSASFFVQNPQHILLAADQIRLIRDVEKLKQDHADFLAQQCQGSTADMRQVARDALNSLANIADGLAYSDKAASDLRTLANLTFLDY
jgi:hypothetical protein